MAASVIHIPMLCSSPGKARQCGKHGQKGMWMNSSLRPSRKASCGELEPLGLNLYYGFLFWHCLMWSLLYLHFAVAETGPSMPAEPKRFSRVYWRNGHLTRGEPVTFVTISVPTLFLAAKKKWSLLVKMYAEGTVWLSYNMAKILNV
ncbi:hypothetical protein RHMOL_Rhmol12G0185000 [Rhododendron molle]|uniref:Uncharacterized protein n=1 Tax=Rhododendron molle TaxID=49168 RepID=A0ACC0LJW9_RHOML|nr:hypothetical protein RHMOL_Rhmol12G0185000 [Rhododendron molle]